MSVFFKFSTASERIVTSSGLSLVGRALSNGFKSVRSLFSIDPSSPEAQIPLTDIIRTAVGVLINGSPEYDAVSQLHDDDEFYARALDIEERIPSEATLRQRLDKYAPTESAHRNIMELNIALLKNNNVTISPIVDDLVNIDCDVSPFDNSKTKKEGVGRTYKGCDGYAPMMAYIGKKESLSIMNSVLEPSIRRNTPRNFWLKQSPWQNGLQAILCWSDLTPEMMQETTFMSVRE